MPHAADNDDDALARRLELLKRGGSRCSAASNEPLWLNSHSSCT